MKCNDDVELNFVMEVLTFFMFSLSYRVRLRWWFGDDDVSLLNVLLGKCNEGDPKISGTRGKYFTNEGQLFMEL